MGEYKRNKVSSVPPYVDFVWMFRTGKVEAELAFFNGRQFTNAESAGDSEGLSVEVICDVEEWQDIEPPNRG